MQAIKPKRILTVVMFVCGLLLAAHSAQAFYNPGTGRWLSRDPIEEEGGNGLYRFIGNQSLSQVDVLGLFIELWYGNHIVKPTKHSHSKLWLLADDADLIKSTKYKFKRALSKTVFAPDDVVGPCPMYGITMGAGPDNTVDKDELIASLNRPSDVLLPLSNPSLVTSFSTAADALRFLDTVSVRNDTMNSNFKLTTLEYELFPRQTYTGFGWDQFNSNSYISGLLSSFGLQPPAPRVSVPGYSKPIPTFVFRQSFANDAALKEEWWRHYPGF